MPGWDHPAVAADLLEREAALDVLESAVVDAAAGHGSVVLLFGQAGIGKTSVVRALRRRVEGRVRVLVGVCDDLLAPGRWDRCTTSSPPRGRVRSRPHCGAAATRC